MLLSRTQKELLARFRDGALDRNARGFNRHQQRTFDSLTAPGLIAPVPNYPSHLFQLTDLGRQILNGAQVQDIQHYS